MRLLVFAVVATVAVGCGKDTSRSSGKSGAAKGAGQLKTLKEIDNALRQERLDFAVKHARRYIAEYPESDKARLLLGWAYVRQENLEKAKDSFTHALSINPANDNAHVGLGVMYRISGDNKRARESYREAIRLLPRNPEALGSLLVIELIEGRYDDAIRYGEQAWQLRKNLPEIPANLCIAYHYKGDSSKRDYYYRKAQQLNYRSMNALDEIIAGRRVIGNPPTQPAGRTTPAKGAEGSR